MKKFLMVLFTLVAFTATAMGEQIDLTTMTTDELFALRENINAEIINRTGTVSSPIYSGTYLIGEDIKAGKYVFKLESSADGVYAYIVTSFGEDDPSPLKQTVQDGESFYLELLDGMTLELDYIKAAYLESISNPSWAP